VTRLADVYRALVRTSLAEQLQYRAANVIWMLGLVLEPLVFLVVWSTVARGAGGSVAGFEPRDFAAYYIALLLVNHLTFSWVMHEFEFFIQSGQLSFRLLRPIHPIHGDLADNLAYKALMLVILLPVAGALALAFEPRFPLGPGLALALPALALGFAVRFLLEWTLALAAFWTTRVTALNQSYFAVLAFLSGRVAPLPLLPDALRAAADVLPFYWMIGFPVELAVGRVPDDRVLAGFAAQAAWVGASAALLALVWARAVRRHAAVGQ
jgi:ABC-2 type transport system permease protein